MTAVAKPRWQPVASPKCVVCAKSVYEIEKLVADDRVFHKSCFKCGHCSKTLSLGNYASIDEKTYCKPHFKQLFAEKGGNYGQAFGLGGRTAGETKAVNLETKGAAAGAAAAKTSNATAGASTNPRVSTIPSAVSSRFGGRKSACPACGKTAYPMESVDVDGASFHKGCFKCVECGVRLSLTTFVKHGSSLYCKRDVPKQEAKVGLSMTLATAMEAQRLASSAASSGDAVARYASAAPAKDSPAKALPPSKTTEAHSPSLTLPLRQGASPLKQKLEQTTPVKSSAKETTPAKSPAEEEATPAKSPAEEETPPVPEPEPEPIFQPGSPEALLEAELAQVVEETMQVAEEITDIIDDVEKKAAAAAEPAAGAAGGAAGGKKKKKKRKGKN